MKIIIEIELNSTYTTELISRQYLDTFKNKLISKILLVINKTTSFYNYWNSYTITTKTDIKIE